MPKTGRERIMRTEAEIRRLFDRIRSVAKAHMNFTMSLQTMSDGSVYVKIGQVANGTFTNLEYAFTFLSGVLAGMTLNRDWRKW